MPTSSPTDTPTPRRSAVTIIRGGTTNRVVALTYDAGADRGMAAPLLAYLLGEDIKVTFGITGRWAESNPDLVRQMVADGHELMNHTYDHRSFTGSSANPPVLRFQDRLDEIERAESIISTIGGTTTKPLFRAPYGDQDESVLQVAAAAGYRYSVLWTVDSLGWRGLSTSEIIDRCLRGAGPGTIYVLHVGLGSHDVEATKTIVDGLWARGYRFETVGELIQEKERQ
jgi:peptidoglycan-N-acetylglucosamine deacetylase